VQSVVAVGRIVSGCEESLVVVGRFYADFGGCEEFLVVVGRFRAVLACFRQCFR